jgi:hypothetical protein
MKRLSIKTSSTATKQGDEPDVNVRQVTGLISRILASAGVGVAILVAGPVSALASGGQHNGSTTVFIRSATESADQSQVTFSVRKGTSNGQTVYYVVTETSDRGSANAMGVNFAPKIARAKGTAAVQVVSYNADGTINFPGTVTFGLSRTVVPGCAPTNTCITDPTTAFPPASISYPAIGDANYSPLIQLPDGTVWNAPQIANSTGQSDKVISLDTTKMQVVYKETEGRYDNRVVHYVSFDASVDAAAALEDVTYAPNLGNAPSAGCADPVVALSPCSRESLIAFTNGQTNYPGTSSNPNRQGLSSAILDGLSPLNILKEIPEGQADPGVPAYSPLWDIHLVAWDDSVAVANRFRQTDFATAEALVGTQAQSLTASGTTSDTFQATGFIVNCPAVSMNPSN